MGKIDLAGIGFRIGDELGESFHQHRRMHFHHIGQPHNASDWYAIADEVERQVFVKGRADGVVRSDERNRVTIGSGIKRGLHTDVAAGARPVLNDKLLAKIIGQSLADDARHNVVRPSRWKRHNPMNRPRRICLRPCCRRNGQYSGAGCQAQKFATRKLDDAPPPTSKMWMDACSLAVCWTKERAWPQWSDCGDVMHGTG